MRFRPVMKAGRCQLQQVQREGGVLARLRATNRGEQQADSTAAHEEALRPCRQRAPTPAGRRRCPTRTCGGSLSRRGCRGRVVTASPRQITAVAIESMMVGTDHEEREDPAGERRIGESARCRCPHLG